jgi:hypothetical protein
LFELGQLHYKIEVAMRIGKKNTVTLMKRNQTHVPEEVLTDFSEKQKG